VGVMAWWLQGENDDERGKRISYSNEWVGDTEARIKAAESRVAEDMTAAHFTPDPGPRPWPASPYDPILGTGAWTGFRHPVPDRPYQMRFTEKVGYLADCFGNIITSRVRDVIETLEPGVHQFFPCELYLKDGTPIPEQRWYLNVCNRLDTIAAEHCNILIHPKHGYYLTGNGKTDVKVWKNNVIGHAIWSEWKYNNDIYVSDALVEAIRSLDVHGWIFRQYLTEV
jgi:hypothetical protein